MTGRKHQKLWLLILIGLCACGGSRSGPQSINSNLQTPATQAPSPPTNGPGVAVDPTCCDPSTTAELKEAWQNFIKDGRYKPFLRGGPEAAASLDNLVCSFTWGDLGYASEGGRHHLAVIVEDTSRTDQSRFGSVIFSAPTGEKGVYHPYWLLKNQDLSQASFFKVSGYLELHILRPNGSTETCDIRWSSALKKYYCRKPE